VNHKGLHNNQVFTSQSLPQALLHQTSQTKLCLISK